MKKKLLLSGLCLAMISASIQQARGLAPYVCYVGGSMLIGGIAYFSVKSCKTKYYCMTDTETGERFYSNATRTERAANDWVITAGPYDSAEEAAAGCVISKPAGMQSAIYVPSRPITILKSTNAVDWVVADRIMDDPDHFRWVDTNAISLNKQMFYCVSAQ